MSKKQRAPLSVRLSPELNARLEQCAKDLRMKKHTLAQEAIEAAVDAIEAGGGKLVIPLEFEVTQIPIPKRFSPPTLKRMELN